jgi:acetyl-CoA synthetase
VEEPVTSPDQRVQQLLSVYGSEQACAADLLCDRHPADAVAFTIVEEDLSSVDLTFGELRARSEKAAAGLAALGVAEGDRVATLMGKSIELVVSLLAIWRLGAVQVPLFTAFAPPAIALRVTGNGTKVVITDAQQRSKLDPGPDLSADREWRIVTTGPVSGDDIPFDALLDQPSDAVRAPVAVGGDGTLIELFTSGTTGAPKGVPVPLKAVAGMQIYQEYALDRAEDDVYWNGADPGWAYGLYYAIVSPLATGTRSLLVRPGFSPALAWSVLAKFGVTNFAAAPTVYRALRTVDVPDGLRLRHCSSAGEPLTPDVVAWSKETLGLEVRDHYGQTETGMLVANAWHPDLHADVRPRSMGRVLPGFTIEVLKADADEIAPVGEVGRVVVDMANSPSMTFEGYVDAPERSAARFSDDRRWYNTGDVAAKDADGYLTFGARDDDVIIMAGYRIGPFEVESVLSSHAAVAEAAVVGVPDELRGEVVVAYVVPRADATPDDALAKELQQLVKSRLSAHAYPRRVHFVEALPKTPSGKVQRFLLRQSRDPGTSADK